MSEDRESVVVATGPKVGSNWICNILCALRYYDKEGGGIRSPFSETQYIDLEREDSYKVIRENSEHKLWKTHSPFQAEFAAWSNVKFININRDLRDVLVSLNFFQMFLARNGQEDKRILDFTPEEYMLRLIEVGDFKKWMKIIASWTGDNFNAKISLRYEDLLKDIHGEISKLCEFLELPCTSYDITSAIESASFENHANGRSPGQEDQNSFYRKGISGDWKNYLTPDVIKSFVEDEGGAWNRLLVRLGYEATEHWFTTETAPVKSLMKDSPSSLKIGLVHHWPGFKNSELDIIKRISQILQRLGHQSWIISPLGEVLCEYQAGEHIDDRFDIEDYELDFVVYFHFLSPKVLDIFSYVVNWNPVDFILKDPVNQTTLDIKELKFRKLCFQSHDEILSAGCAQADALVSSFGTAEVPVITGSESILHPTCQKISNLEFPALDQFKVFYIGAQWERISNVDRHGSLLEMLDKTGHFKFFGVRNRGNKYLWENIDNYYGELPFDGGKSIALNSNMCGVSLVLHSPQHRSNDLVSSRIFQACAAKTVIIADDNPWIIDHFGDSVLTFEYRHLDNEWNFNRINDLLLWIKNNPTEALAKARRANQIFSDHFSLEIEVEHLVQHYWNKFSMTNISSKVVDRDQLIHIIYFARKNSISDFLEDLQKQKDIKAKCWIYCLSQDLVPVRNKLSGLENQEYEVLLCTGEFPNLGKVLLDIGTKVSHKDAVVVYSEELRWKNSHLITLLRNLKGRNKIVHTALFSEMDRFKGQKRSDYSEIFRSALTINRGPLIQKDLVHFDIKDYYISSFIISAELLKDQRLPGILPHFDHGSVFALVAISYLQSGQWPTYIPKLTGYVRKSDSGHFNNYRFSAIPYEDERRFFHLTFGEELSIVTPENINDPWKECSSIEGIKLEMNGEPSKVTSARKRNISDDNGEGRDFEEKQIQLVQTVASEPSTLLTITGIKNRVKYARERLVISQSGLFDRSWYLENYPDVRSAGIDPLRHFIIYGWREYRNPSATFNVYNYLQSYPEVLAAGSCPLMHYIKNPVLEV